MSAKLLSSSIDLAILKVLWWMMLERCREVTVISVTFELANIVLCENTAADAKC